MRHPWKSGPSRRGCGCGPTHHPSFGGHFEARHYWDGESAGGFGVRRPLRFLAWKLGLDDEQVTSLAAILNELKTERAQFNVDDRRALTQLASAVEGETFEHARAAEAAKLRQQSAERLQQRIVESLERIHALLRPEQRGRIAYLLRTGTLVM